MGHKTQLYLNEPGRRVAVSRGETAGTRFAEGHAPAGNGKWGGFEYNCSCVLSGKHSCMTTKPRSRCVHVRRVCWTCSRNSRASAKPKFLTLRWWSETAGCAVKGQKGNRDRRLCSPTAECQTNLVLSVRSAIFPNGEMERQRNVAVGKWPCSRLMPMSWPGEASRTIACPRRRRSLAPYCRCLARAKHRGLLLVLAGRSLAASCFFGRARSVPDCLASLRPSECSETLAELA